MKKEYKKRLIAWGIVVIMLGVAYYKYNETMNEIIDGIRAIDDIKILICCLVATIFFMAEGFIISTMAKCEKTSFKWIKGFEIAYLCEFFRILSLGSGSGVAAIYYLQKEGVPASKGTGMTFMQFGLKKFAILIMGVIGWICLMLDESTKDILVEYNTFMILGFIFTALVALVMMGFAFSKRLNRFGNWILDKLINKFGTRTKKFEKWREDINQVNEIGLYIIHYPKLIILNIFGNMLKFTAIYFIPSYILIGDCSLSVVESILLICVVNMVDVVIPVPSGIGSFEYLFVLFFEQFAEAAVSLPAVLVYRFATWIVPFFIGMIIWFVSKIREIIMENKKGCDI